jgi:hypothetical protein
MAGLINDTARYLEKPWHVPAAHFAADFAVLVTLYFWLENVIGIRESSDKALRIMPVTTAMVVILIVWGTWTVITHGFQPVPLPEKANLRFGPDFLGWLQGTVAPNLILIALMIGLD